MSDSNGNQHPIDPELISAFYDGETTPEERAAVEQWMDESTDTLQTLDEYDQLSQDLKELHRATTAPDLRETVLASVASATPATSRPGSALRERRRLLSMAAGMAGLAAVVTILVWPQFQRSRLGDAVAVNELRDAEDLEATALRSEAADEARGVPSLAESAIAREESPSPSSGVTAAEMEANIEMTLADIARERPLPEVGDVLGYLDQNADELTWVAVTVVDAQKAGDQVRLLLARHGVESPAPSPGEMVPSQTGNSLVTFVVEADWNQMEAVIVDLSEASYVDAVTVDAPAEEGVPQELQSYAVNRSQETRAAVANAPALQLQQRVKDMRNAAGSRPEPQDREVGAVQVQTVVPDEYLKRIAARRDAEGALAGTPPAAPEADASAASADRAEEGASPRLRATLARPRAKAVIVLQKPVE